MRSIAVRAALFAVTVSASASAGPDDGYSNIYPEDYVGPDKCAECHPGNHRLWQDHPHRWMNQDASAESVMGDFAAARIRYGGGDRHIEFRTERGDYTMTLLDGRRVVRRFKVTRVAGSRFGQFYLGVQLDGPEPAGHPAYGKESKLPFAYWFGLDRWLPEIYFDSFAPAEESYDGDTSFADYVFDNPPEQGWETSCITCHNTYPYIARFRDGGRAWTPGFPRQDFALDDDGGSAPWIAWHRQPSSIQAEELVTLGISCESCHFGGREHAIEGRAIRFVPTSPHLRLKAGVSDAALDRHNPYVVNNICRQCHSAKIGRFADGTPMWNSAEAVDLGLGHCASRIKCTDCHDPHRAGAPGGAPDDPRHVQACLECHPQLAGEAARAEHARHGPEVSCLDCHMPRMVQGLETVVRSHRISSPTDPAMLASAAPNACNLCHPEQTMTWTLAELEKGWDVAIEPGQSWIQWYGPDLGLPVGRAWLVSPEEVTRLVATHAYGVSPDGPDALPLLLNSLNDRFGVNRVFGLIAIERILGRKLTDDEYDLLATSEVRRKQVESLRERVGRLVAGAEDDGV